MRLTSKALEYELIHYGSMTAKASRQIMLIYCKDYLTRKKINGWTLRKMFRRIR
jgi:hypothetical protein